MKTQHAAVIVALAALAAGAVQAADKSADKQTLARGKYLVQVGGCNDCHTPNYMQTDGKVAEADWLVGAPVGFQGPWGTTYPANLRLMMQGLSEREWVTRARSAMRPPMPWFNLAAMTEGDLRAIYSYVRSLGPKGEAAPAYVAPGGKVNTPYFVFVPQNLPPAPQALAK